MGYFSLIFTFLCIFIFFGLGRCEYGSLHAALVDYLSALTDAGVRLVVIVDGMQDLEKESTTLERRRSQVCLFWRRNYLPQVCIADTHQTLQIDISLCIYPEPRQYPPNPAGGCLSIYLPRV